MKKLIVLLISLALVGLGAGSALAEGYSWKNHAAPFDFLFGNHIDTHQQSKVERGDKLEGFFYIKFTGTYTPDGIPVAEHGNCNQTDCTVGWLLAGVPVQATLVGHPEGQHPTWCVDPADLPRQSGYSHFHWLGAPEHADGIQPGIPYDGYLLRLTARETFFFNHHGGFLVTPGLDEVTHANVITDC